ncbi:GAF domain-containing protein [Alkalilacustris brevis]|uniref:GAF domain-containing protein n=1 Tax=Alkalilacustris brevis TaxID=2026338 RepID=UPI000E0CD971|nr:GAF domain-containing protein [Alkalilacustris brevis]
MVDFPQDTSEHLRQLKLSEGGFDRLVQDPELDALCTEAKELFGVESVAITLLTRDKQLFPARAGTEIECTPRNMAFCKHTIMRDAVFVVKDAHLDPRFRDIPLTTGGPHIRFYAGAPLIYQEGIRLGAFCLMDSAPRDFSLGDEAELMDFAERAISIMLESLDKTAR